MTRTTPAVARPLPVTGWACPECARLTWPGYCAPRRCYCGHPACNAYPSWKPLRQLHAVPDVPEARSTAWAEREDDTWIDRM